MVVDEIWSFSVLLGMRNWGTTNTSVINGHVTSPTEPEAL